MDIKTITEQWIPLEGSRRAGVEWWNGKAQHFAEIELPTAEKSVGMRIIERENMVKNGSFTLDVGCGCGRFSFALEAMGAEATATDFSPEMIKKAMEIAEDRGSKVHFSVDDWREMDLERKGWKGKFDLVLANMTPAVVSADTFMKLIGASRNWVLMVKPTRRSNTILDELNKIVGAECDTKPLDETMAYAFDLAWLSGSFPRLEYEQQVWEMDMPLEEAVDEYTLRIGSLHELKDGDKAKIRDYLGSVAVNGNVHETTHTAIVAMYWQVRTALQE